MAHSARFPTASAPTAEDVELRPLRSELLHLIANQARHVPAAVIAGALVMAWLVSDSVERTWVLVWLALVMSTTVLHSALLAKLPRWKGASDDHKLTLAAISFAVHGLMQCSLLLSFPHVPLTVSTVLTVYAVGLSAATVPAVAGFPRIFIPYSLCTLGPAIAAWLLPSTDAVSSTVRITIGVLAAAFLLTMWGHARGSFRVFTSLHRMREERLELTRQLRDALSRAELANAAKSRFLASASHDLRQPIHALTLFSGSLLMRPLDARTTAIAEQIDKAIQVLGSQLDALLDISRLDAGVIERHLEVVDLQLMLQLLLQEFQPQAQLKQLTLQLQCEERVLVRSDPALLLRVLRNLVSSAVKYTRAGQVLVQVRSDAGQCELTVSDTGRGIPAEEQQRVFEEFYQLENPERDRSKGLGLGLAIVRRLTALLEIDLTLHSAVGEGSRFVLTLPLSGAGHSQGTRAGDLAQPTGPASRQFPEASQAVQAAQSAIRVLVVDDEEAIRLGMQTLLGEMGFSVALAASTEAAVALAREFAPSIVLADFRLHGEDDGMRTIAALRDRQPQLPALLISGDTAPDRLQKAHAAGIELLHKPVAAASLRAAILRAVQA